MASPPRRRLSLAERQQLAREQMEIESYSVSELKRALDMRGIDHRDALEKAELLQRLRQDMSDEENMGVIAQSRTDELLPSERSVVALFERCSPSVAFIQTTEAVQVKGDQQLSLNATEERPAGTGTGFVWDEQGHVVTNFHVIKDAINRGRAMVTLTGGTETHAATLVGMEPDKDVAVLKVDAPPEDLKPISVGSSADLLVGQTVIAIGNPFGLDSTLTTGVVSALGREVMGVNDRPISGCIQTDASINPGNSGGPLLDSSGRLIGVNTAIFSPSGASVGIGFAIPVDTVRRIVNQVIPSCPFPCSHPRCLVTKDRLADHPPWSRPAPIHRGPGRRRRHPARSCAACQQPRRQSTRGRAGDGCQPRLPCRGGGHPSDHALPERGACRWRYHYGCRRCPHTTS